MTGPLATLDTFRADLLRALMDSPIALQWQSRVILLSGISGPLKAAVVVTQVVDEPAIAHHMVALHTAAGWFVDEQAVSGTAGGGNLMSFEETITGDAVSVEKGPGGGVVVFTFHRTTKGAARDMTTGGFGPWMESQETLVRIFCRAGAAPDAPACTVPIEQPPGSRPFEVVPEGLVATDTRGARWMLAL